ncbi:MAG TPA: hypothetical protein DIC34_09305 [Treponema sp.]|nr:MAG: hypothetical protein A2Y36_05305 [Treponema sp. GWA1_62_8]OHE64441.1 MAG: hypothetical protein A2001_02140 [Treponema sp. GWC1_61_84]OHE76333.1 MAG: hypothetical protein A2413_16290 [Treponema sp. RIFOXYC1_FULL_61_9]HCM26724.1 hypothetical protein [Treponema sp.]
MDLPVIPTPVFDRWVWMEEFTFSHIPIAAVITAWMFLAPILELIGYRKRDLRYDRLSKSLVYFSMILFSPGAALGTGIPFLIIGLYPEFWARWANMFFWPLIFQFILFTMEVLFLFNFYYLTWDKTMHRKRTHIACGFIAALMGELIQLIWDGIGSYMLTPGGVPLPAVNEPVGFSLAGYLNPSFLSLFLHRSFGNLSFTLLLAGGVFAFRHMRHRVPTEKAYYGFAADVTFTLGFLFFFAQPVIGWFYARVIQGEAPVAFIAMMGGHAWYYFIPKLLLILVFVFIAGTYVFVRHRDKPWLLGAISIGLASFYVIFLNHPPLRVFGSPLAWRIAYTAGILGFIAYLWFVRWRGPALRVPGWQIFLLVAGLASTAVFFFGGNMRERVRSPQTVYGWLEKPEATDYERNRFLTYEKCIGCHIRSPRDLVLPAGETWNQRVAAEARRPEVSLSDEEVVRIASYLEEVDK